MDFSNINLKQHFTDKQKTDSFLYLQKYIFDKISQNQPFFIGRLSGVETALCGSLINKKKISKELIKELLYNAGIKFNNSNDAISYTKYYNTACKNADVLGIWAGETYLQAILYYQFISKYFPNKKCICAQGLEPYYYINDSDYKYNKIFENKKVLIITSHSETIKQQLHNHLNIFNKPIFHETTQFFVYKGTQQNAGNHDNNNWIYHLDKMKKDIKEIKEIFNYDIVLTGCGGFSMLISDYIYTELKTSVIYVGGSLQLFFGIMGNRWKTNSKIMNLTNKNWTSVLNEDIPKSLKLRPELCENSCYW